MVSPAISIYPAASTPITIVGDSLSGCQEQYQKHPCVHPFPEKEGHRRSEQDSLCLFESAVLPHLDAAHSLARWLTRNETDAEDVVQEAFLRAFKFFGGFYGADGRAWLFSIVRNTCRTWLRHNRAPELSTAFDEEIHSAGSDGSNPEELLLRGVEKQLLWKALEELPASFRQVLILRELEGRSYKEIAGKANIPVGTVMSRLARARKRLRVCLSRDAYQPLREYTSG